MYSSVWYPPLKPCGLAADLYAAVLGGEEAEDLMGWHVALIMDGKPVAAGRLSYIKAGLGEISRVCAAPEFRGQGLEDAAIRLLIFKASQLGIDYIQASGDAVDLKLLKAIGFQPAENNMYVKEVCDGCCEDCKNKCSGSQE